MDTNIAATRIAATTPQGAAGAGANAQGNTLGGGNGVFASMGGLSFIDMIFARITQGTDLKNETEGAVSAPLTREPDMSTAGLMNQIIDQDIANIDNTFLDVDLTALAAEQASALDLTQTSAQAANDAALPQISAQMQQLRDYLDTLLNGVPAGQRPQIVEINTAEFKQILADLKADLDAGNPALIATGLTPEKLSALMAKVESAEKNGTLQAMMMVKIVAPDSGNAEKPIPLLLPRALIAIQDQAQNGSDAALPKNDAEIVKSALNSLVVQNNSGNNPSALASAAAAGAVSAMPGGLTAEAAAAINADIDAKTAAAEDEAQAEIKADAKTSGTEGKNIPSAAEKAAAKNYQAMSAGLSTISNNELGSIETAGNWAEALPENMDAATGLSLGAKTLSAATGALASVSQAASHAAYPHPATQAVAASISKNASTTEDKAFTIKLDPPELGRVEVKMAIDKNNALKAHLIIEKPETFMMLQRDAQILERSLQGIGMDTGDGGISFELAQDNMFQNEGERGGERYQASKKTGGAEKIDEVIETTMTWHVDPQTGMQRYNILA